MHRSVAAKSKFALAMCVMAALAPLPGARAGTLRGNVIFPAIHEDVDPRPEARKPLGAWRLENGRLRIAAEADVRRDVVLALAARQPVTAAPQPVTIEARPGGLLSPRITLCLVGVVVTWKNADTGARTVTLEDGDTLLPPESAPPGASREVRFTFAGEYMFLDPEHPLARSLVVVKGTPFITRADERGAFTLEAPDGKYDLQAWWNGRWIDVAPVELGPRARDPVTVRLLAEGTGRVEVKAEPVPARALPSTLAAPPAAIPGGAAPENAREKSR